MKNKMKKDYSVDKIEVVDGKNTDLAINKPVYAIHFTNKVKS